MLYRPMNEDSVYTIGDIYNKNKLDNKKMLSDYGSDFWQGYRANHDYFDRRFKIMYKSWYPVEQETEEGLESVADDFRYDVYAHLMANDKRYSEIYRINVIQDDTAYSLTNNVDYTETLNETSNRDIEFNKGAQANSDEGFTAYGSKQNGETKSITIGQQQDGETISKTYGAKGATDTHTVSAYNDSGYAPADKNEHSEQTYTDGENNSYTKGSRSDSENNTYTEGSHRDDSTNIHSEGARRDTTDDDVTHNSTMHKVGNMGVQTVDDMLLKHWDNWNLFDFYGLIFKEIARDLLRGV